MITVGRILKPQGVRGEVKVKPLTDDPSRFSVLKSVDVDGKSYRVGSVRNNGNDVFIKLVGVDDRNAAESLRGAYIRIDRAAALPLSDGEFYIADLVGAELCARTKSGSPQSIGVIKSIDSFGAADVFTVECLSGDEMTFAFVKALAAEFDGKRLIVDKDRLAEVAVYEN